MGWTSGRAMALHGLGLAAWRRGDSSEAATRLRASLALRQRLGEPLGAAECLEGLAAVAAGTGEAGQAARWLGAAEAIREAIGAPLPPVERPDREATLAAVRAALGEAAGAAALAAGRALPPGQATAEALGDASASRSPADERAVPLPAPAPGGLSRREAEVLRLVAAGRSNREVAEELALSVRTVERHITNLYGKIGAKNRADATAFALRHGLA
jgi:non-specific serine/threonine protein kinase